MIPESSEELNKIIEERINILVPELFKSSAFSDRKVTDTPTDALQVVNKKYVDGKTLYGRMYLTGGQSIGTDSETKVALNNTEYAVGITADSSTNRQFTILTTGTYAIAAQIWYSVGSANDIHTGYLKINSSYIVEGRTIVPTTNASSIVLFGIKELNEGDTVQLWTKTSNGQDLLSGSGIYTYLEIFAI